MNRPNPVSQIGRRVARAVALVTFAAAPHASFAEDLAADGGWLLPYTLKLGDSGTSFAPALGQSMELGLNLAPTATVLDNFLDAGSTIALRAAGSPVRLSGTSSVSGTAGCLAVGTNPITGCTSASTLLDAYSVGAIWAPSDRFSVSLDYFSRPVLMDHSALSMPVAAKSFGRPSVSLAPSWQNALATAEGLDVNMALALPSARLGQLALGFEVAKILPDGDSVNLVPEPFTRAIMDLGWAAGDFRGSLVSRYLSDQSANSEVNSWTSLDLNLAWRMPWRGSLSVGARNVLDSQAPRIGGITSESFESGMGDSLGRVPYVRYQQDL